MSEKSFFNKFWIEKIIFLRLKIKFSTKLCQKKYFFDKFYIEK